MYSDISVSHEAMKKALETLESRLGNAEVKKWGGVKP